MSEVPLHGDLVRYVADFSQDPTNTYPLRYATPQEGRVVPMNQSFKSRPEMERKSHVSPLWREGSYLRLIDFCITQL